MRTRDKETQRARVRRRSAFTLIEIMVVMWALGLLLMVGAVLIAGTLRVRQAAASAFNTLNARTELADRFRADVHRAVLAPDASGSWTAGPTCLLLRQPDGGHIVYSWKDGRLERIELPSNQSRPLSVGSTGTVVEFLRSGEDRRLLTMQLSPPRPRGAPSTALEITAALGGDRR